jgi:hypothetical protein
MKFSVGSLTTTFSSTMMVTSSLSVRSPEASRAAAAASRFAISSANREPSGRRGANCGRAGLGGSGISAAWGAVISSSARLALAIARATNAARVSLAGSIEPRGAIAGGDASLGGVDGQGAITDGGDAGALGAADSVGRTGAVLAFDSVGAVMFRIGAVTSLGGDVGVF